MQRTDCPVCSSFPGLKLKIAARGRGSLFRHGTEFAPVCFSKGSKLLILVCFHSSLPYMDEKTPGLTLLSNADVYNLLKHNKSLSSSSTTTSLYQNVKTIEFELLDYFHKVLPWTEGSPTNTTSSSNPGSSLPASPQKPSTYLKQSSLSPGCFYSSTSEWTKELNHNLCSKWPQLTPSERLQIVNLLPTTLLDLLLILGGEAEARLGGEEGCEEVLECIRSAKLQ